MNALIETLPHQRGRYRAQADLAKSNWFQVGGPAECLFRPEDADDLAQFIGQRPRNVGVTVLGVGSNLLVRDGGIDGVVIRLGRAFTHCHAEGVRLTVGAGCLNANAVAFARDRGIGGLEFLSGIPGSIGGALFMNAGAYGTETCDVLIEAEAIDPEGRVHVLTRAGIDYRYRSCGLPAGWIFTRATFAGSAEAADVIAARIDAITESRASTQPVRSRTGGSTFKNPEGDKAWRLIDAAGCRGLTIGGAQMSELHCNFMINTGGATAQDLESLGETVIQRVRDHSGVTLQWEIKRIGNPARKLADIIAA